MRSSPACAFLPMIVAAVAGCGQAASSPAPETSASAVDSPKPKPETPEKTPPARPRLAAIDVYGSKTASEAAILSVHESAIRAAWAAPREARKVAANAIAKAIMDSDEIAFATVSFITYFDAGTAVSYATVDLVDQSDATSRMPFRAPPGLEPPDLAGLPAAWQTYEDRMRELLHAGTISGARKACPAWHCVGDYDHPELAPLIEPVRSGVEANKEALVALLFDHKDPQVRANAAFVLAHIDDGDAVVGWMLRAMFDNSAHVRNNAVRVLSDIAFHHPKQAIPAAPLLRALDFPTTTDRNKALAVVYGLLARPGSESLASLIRSDTETVARLLALLKLRQPNNHDFAYLILKFVSDKDHGARDYNAWRGWVDSLAKAP